MYEAADVYTRALARLWKSSEQHFSASACGGERADVATGCISQRESTHSTLDAVSGGHWLGSRTDQSMSYRMLPAIVTRTRTTTTTTITMTRMPHLPNELWLQVLCYCSPRDQWLGLRLTTRQLKACVEQHWEREVLPSIDISMPVALPTYDMRNPLRGKATFQPVSARTGRGTEGRMWLELTSTEPEYYHEHFLGRWSGMRDNANGTLSKSVRWDVRLGTVSGRMRLQDARAEVLARSQEARVSFEWMGTVTRLFTSDG